MLNFMEIYSSTLSSTSSSQSHSSSRRRLSLLESGSSSNSCIPARENWTQTALCVSGTSSTFSSISEVYGRTHGRVQLKEEPSSSTLSDRVRSLVMTIMFETHGRVLFYYSWYTLTSPPPPHRLCHYHTQHGPHRNCL